MKFQFNLQPLSTMISSGCRCLLKLRNILEILTEYLSKMSFVTMTFSETTSDVGVCSIAYHPVTKSIILLTQS